LIPISKPLIEKQEKQRVLEVLESGMLAQGEKVSELEQKFAKYCAVKNAVATSNGTTALLTALQSMGLKGEVLVPSFTFFASVSSIHLSGLKPVFVDIDSKTYNMDAKDAEKKITSKTTAVMPVHLFGQTCDMNAITNLAKQNNLKIIEDACQAHGARWDGRRAGSLGDAGCFSFYPTKNMTAGEGGMVTTNDDALAEKMRKYRNHGQEDRYKHVSWGYNYRMTDLQAALGLAQLDRLDEFIKTRRKNARYYDLRLKGVKTPRVLEKAFHVYHQYTISVENRDTMVEKFKQKGVGYGIYYPIPAHKQPVVGSKASLPNTEKACQQVISIPVHPSLSKEDLKTVVEAVNDS
jgi:perosamine synthetase